MRAALALAAVLSLAVSASAVPAADVLTPIGGLPPQIVGQFRDAAAFIQTDDGRFVVYDRRAQIIYGVDAAKKTVNKLVPIGPLDGEILRPLSFAVSTHRTLIVLDNPGDYERVQTFYDTGTPLTMYRRAGESNDALRINVDSMLSSGLGPISAIGTNFLAQAPDGQSLFGEFTPQGQMVRRIGVPRPTGHERDRPLHQALNTGIALAAPDGSLYFVFTTGIPMIRKYSRSGALVFERHVEGPELDETIQGLPTVWPLRTLGKVELPAVTPTVSTASIDRQGRLWVSLTVPFTYVYDAAGNKLRTVQFTGAGPIVPKQLFFTKGGTILVAPGCYEFTG